jgi:dipeptidyl aminopeptidase/acylaminoacyl peptidase
MSESKDGVPSPDGTRIAFTNLGGSEIWVAGVDGNAARLVRAGSATLSSLIWSPDSKRIEYRRQDPVAAKDRPSELASEQSGQGGQLTSASASIKENYQFSYESLDIATGQLIASARSVVMASACGLPDGRVLFLSWISAAREFERQLWELRTNPHTGELLGPARRLSNTAGLDLDSISASSDGKQVVAVLTAERPNVYIADLPESKGVPRLLKIEHLTDDEADHFPHAWSADSRMLIYESNRTGRYQLYRQNIGDNEAQPLVVAPGNTVLPCVSSDGKWVLYRSDDRSRRHRTLMRVSIAGGIPEPLGIDLQDDDYRCALEPRGGCVLRSVENGQFIFYELDPVRGKGRELARTAGEPPVTGDWDLSPDGARVAIPNHTSLDGKIRVVVLRGRTPGSEGQTVTLSGLTNLNAAVWSADGNGWYVTVRAALEGGLFYANLQGQSWELSPSISMYVVPSPDGRHIAFPNSLGLSNAWSFSGF